MTGGGRRIVVMGVSGAGKSTVGARLAERLGLRFVDGDALHSAANVAKMAAGTPLDDADRRAWLDEVGDVLAGGGVAVACSALKRTYRDRLRARSGCCLFVYLALPIDLARQRVVDRPGHFIPAALIDDQFATLEPPQPDEADMLTFDAGMPIDVLIDRAALAIV
jgi:gluconokinase